MPEACLRHDAKPFLIPKREIWEAFKRVKANQGAAGVDGQSIEDFEANLSGNLYKLWNRMSSGSCFPPVMRDACFQHDAACRYSESKRWHQAVGHSNGRRSRRPRSRPSFSGAAVGTGVSSGLLRLQARQICHRCRRQGQGPLLAL
jgi:RNA-directed DNA polymerase